MVFSGIYPIDNNDYDNLRQSLEKLLGLSVGIKENHLTIKTVGSPSVELLKMTLKNHYNQYVSKLYLYLVIKISIFVEASNQDKQADVINYFIQKKRGINPLLK